MDGINCVRAMCIGTNSDGWSHDGFILESKVLGVLLGVGGDVEDGDAVEVTGVTSYDNNEDDMGNDIGKGPEMNDIISDADEDVSSDDGEYHDIVGGNERNGSAGSEDCGAYTKNQ